uniref:Uncharacterized protein n=1 Tax=uncultured marine thaumarchaeote KM3_56_F06 TaxID=1456204 RepID=A0A075H7W7_9ARCH|nr:hypothetical protein [uncultured marine thaumarchaeote KM3_56_F06]
MKTEGGLLPAHIFFKIEHWLIYEFHKKYEYNMAKRIQCPHCKKNLAGEGHLNRQLRTIHKLKNNKTSK